MGFKSDAIPFIAPGFVGGLWEEGGDGEPIASIMVSERDGYRKDQIVLSAGRIVHGMGVVAARDLHYVR
ncbi:hypothetical protein [Paenarthrobacter sp. 2TAF44]|uniref:hypothetical protein n=1 Tax=Paenarthrobacter sp. 2TAF44 TaxID=3233018 RepID=UPI003F9593B9